MSTETSPVPEVRVSLDGVRRRASDSRGRTYWKSLEELGDTPEFLEFLHREFPQNADEFTDPEGRREFLKVMGASLALAGLTACTKQPAETIVPYVRQPEDIVPGRPLFFATVVTEGGYAKGVLVESHMGRPTKIEGNPEHPASLGATDAQGQAAILGLYDPDRAQTVRSFGEIHSWAEFLAALKPQLEKQKPLLGAGLRILTETLTSPTLAKQLRDLLAAYPKAKWHQYDPTAPDNARAGALLAFGEAVETRHALDKADVVLAIDADFIGEGPGNVRAIGDFASRRKLQSEKPALNRLYTIESTPTLAGANADHRLPVKPSEVEGIVRAIAAGLGLPVDGGTKEHAEWLGPMLKDLQRRAGASAVLAGESLSPAAHAIVHLINQQLGNVGATVLYTAPIVAESVDRIASLTDLVRDMAETRVDVLLVIGGNPAYTAPADVAFTDAMMKVPFRARLGLYDDETSERCHWILPETHSLEAWSDARAWDGTTSIVQPLIAPLYEGRSAHELISAFAGRPDRSGYESVREYWKSQLPAADFERTWQRALHDGSIAGTSAPAKAVSVKLGDWARAAATPAEAGIEIVFRADPSVGDGRYANSGWLQELPKPLTKLTWDNAVLMSLNTARSLGVTTSSNYDGRVESGGQPTPQGTITDVVELKFKGRAVSGPAWVLPGHPDGVVTVHLGYGRTRVGRVANGVGFDAYGLRTTDALWAGAGASVTKTGRKQTLACTQDHWSMEGRPIIRSGTLEEFEKDPEFAQEMGEAPAKDMTLYPPHPYEGHAWGMAVDLNSCVGCNACITACQSENNIPVVGRDQVGRGREMHWIRVDRYYAGDPTKPESLEAQHQPVLCQHCEDAPCEVVCPVAATVHSDEGLNDMVYNRCVGTRYCSNNCPYKVRRFNFYLYQDWTTPSLKMMRNPDVSIRSRGVMEKCSYCVQRINQVRIDAKTEGRAMKDGEIQTACQQACPAEAIVFGDVNDAKSRVSTLKAGPRNYGLLADLNTRPRTTYLAAVRNPNPEMPQHG
jgi:molybdopterin-containing oxidoreductase family iron-sulfur binding subunit